MAQFEFRITSPAAGSQVSRVVTVTGTDRSVGTGLPSFIVERVEVQFGPGGPVVVATGAGSPGSWTATGTVPPSSPDDAEVTLTARALGTKIISVDPDRQETFNIPAQVTVRLEPRPPELMITPGYENDVTPAALPYRARISGTTSGVFSGITDVSFVVDGGPSGHATNDPPGDWSAWHAEFDLPEARNYPFTVTATDARGRRASQPGAILVNEAFATTDPAIVFGPTIYVRELCDFVEQYVVVAGQSGGPDRAALTSRFHQPFDRLVHLEAYQAATRPVDQRRIAVEVLRLHLGDPLPGEIEQALRAEAYEALLEGLGTSLVELRGARVADADARITLALRLGFSLGPTRPDRLDDLTLDPDRVSDEDLMALFGFRSTRLTDPFEEATGLPAVQAWRQAELRRRWLLEDLAGWRRPGDPTPVVDPDHVRPANLASSDAGDPVAVLRRDRGDLVATQAANIDRFIRREGRSVATLDQLVTIHIGPLDLVALAARDEAGEDVTEELRSVQLGLVEFRYLVGARELLSVGELLDTEWADVRDILVQVHKLRLFPEWRQQEAAADLVLHPQQFRPDPSGSDTGTETVTPSRWRADAGLHRDWLRTLELRAAEADRVGQQSATAVRSAEVAVLPRVRQALLVRIGSQLDPPESAIDTAERLSRLLCLDLLSDSELLTSRAEQAAQTLLQATVALRSGRLPDSDGTPGWALDEAHEPLFDREWLWMGSLQGWHAAITAFAYPENQLFPGLFLPDGLTLAPTGSYYRDFLPDLRARRLTPLRARDLARENWDRIGPTLDIKDRVADLVPLTEQHTNQQLTRSPANSPPSTIRATNRSCASCFG